MMLISSVNHHSQGKPQRVFIWTQNICIMEVFFNSFVPQDRLKMRVGWNGIWIFLRINTLVKIITISSNVIGASAVLYITYLSVQL